MTPKCCCCCSSNQHSSCEPQGFRILARWPSEFIQALTTSSGETLPHAAFSPVGGIGDAIVLQDGEALRTIGTDVGVHNGDLLGAGLSSGGQSVIAHFQSSQAILCALGIDQIQNFLTVILV